MKKKSYITPECKAFIILSHGVLADSTGSTVVLYDKDETTQDAFVREYRYSVWDSDWSE